LISIFDRLIKILSKIQYSSTSENSIKFIVDNDSANNEKKINMHNDKVDLITLEEKINAD
jgi:hypothetical protein